MKTPIRFLVSFIALSLAGFAFAAEKPADKKEGEKKECCGCADCKECKAGNCCCAEKPEKKETKKDEKPAQPKKS